MGQRLTMWEASAQGRAALADARSQEVASTFPECVRTWASEHDPGRLWTDAGDFLSHRMDTVWSLLWGQWPKDTAKALTSLPVNPNSHNVEGRAPTVGPCCAEIGGAAGAGSWLGQEWAAG